jgi:hypothetical protein
MSNIRSRRRWSPLSRTDVLGSTPGAFPIVAGTYLGDSDDPGVDATDAHFRLVGIAAGEDEAESSAEVKPDAPPRYIVLGYNTGGTDAANIDSNLVVEFWDPTTSKWYQSAPMQVQGSAALDLAANNDVGESLTVQVHPGATMARFWVPIDLGANQELHVVAYPDNGG